MNNLKKMALSALIALLPFQAGAAEVSKPAQEKTKQAATASNVAKATPATPTYKPPLRGAPAGRVGGGTRGATDRESFSLLALAPDHIGYTVQDQPCLYWYISKPTAYPVELTLTERNAVKPLVETTLKAPDRGGIHSVCLADYGVKLRKNVQYKWFVTLVTDASHRSKDILAGGIMSLVDAPPSLQDRLKASAGNATSVYAEEGLWYDALGALSSMIDASPDNTELRKQRAALLEQVGLNEAANSDSRP
ncbi:MAG: DUF928 domain-containing protein [Verrucomicrobia bacterium]|nr:DUF928 domain-containing protein [Deltaproteobacteria bacterium]